MVSRKKEKPENNSEEEKVKKPLHEKHVDGKKEDDEWYKEDKLRPSKRTNFKPERKDLEKPKKV